MIRGLLCIDKDLQDDLLVFICPHCKKEHAIMVNHKGAFARKEYNTWHFKITEPGIVELSPSFDNSKKCGYHSEYAWTMEIMVLGPDNTRNDQTESWLKNL